MAFIIIKVCIFSAALSTFKKCIVKRKSINIVIPSHPIYMIGCFVIFCVTMITSRASCN